MCSTLPRNTEDLTDVEALRENVGETYISLGRNAPGAKVAQTDSMWSCSSRFAHPIGNFAAHFRLSPRELGHVVSIAEAKPHFRAYVMDGDLPVNLGKQLEKAGLKPRYALVGMVAGMRTEPGHPVLERDLSKDRVEVTSKFVSDTFFWRSDRGTKRSLATLLAASADTQEFYSLSDASGTVAAAALSITGGVAGLYNLCVRLDRRSAGIGSSAVSQMIRLAAQRKLRLVLQCEDSLASWYSALGFEKGAELVAYSL